MKYRESIVRLVIAGRPPHRGAWIEIFSTLSAISLAARRPPHRGAWIEIPFVAPAVSLRESPPAQGGVD